jgi:predicted HicB family RNase H-like nuclease
LKEPIVTKSEVFQEFDLVDLTGVDTSSRPELGLSIGQAIIDYMLDRIKDNKGIGGERLDSPGYSKEYQKSEEFIAYQKSANDVNMELTGSMLADIDILEFSGDKIKIGFSDETEKLKAYNHFTGDTVPTRRFFGLTKDEVENVLKDFQDDLIAILEEQKPSGEASTIQSLRDLFSREDRTVLPTFRSRSELLTLLDLLGDD